MKTNLLKAIALAIVMTTCFNCSVEPMDNSQNLLLETQNSNGIEQTATAMTCTGSNPKTRITNNGTFPSDYEIYDSNGVFIDGVYDVLPGTVSAWIFFPEGAIIFNVKIDTTSDQKVIHDMETCTELNLIIDSNNQLVDAIPQSSTT